MPMPIQMSLPIPGRPHAYCLDPLWWTAKFLLCADCLYLRKDCTCKIFRCCVLAHEDMVMPEEIYRRRKDADS